MNLVESGKIQEALLNWYDNNKRDLPWRKTKDPYIIWLSEIIMQQTRIEQGTRYFLKFVDSFPTVYDLANANEQEVLKLWQGLGYYSRARNMHYTAQTIVKQYNGLFPDSYDELIKLKGIGDYTACEILSFCFNKPFAVLDGNVFRLLSRLFEVTESIGSSNGKSVFKKLADKLISESDPGDFNQAMMDLGATICLPANPLCGVCPVSLFCKALINNRQSDFPKKKAKQKLTKRYLHYFLLYDEEGIFINKRSGNDIWKNLYDLPLIENLSQKCTVKEINDLLNIQIKGIKSIYKIKHPLSHRLLHINFYKIKLPDHDIFSQTDHDFLFICYSEADKFPLPKPLELFLTKEGILKK